MKTNAERPEPSLALLALAALFFAGCGHPPTTDGGTPDMDGGSEDASVELCAADTECNDGAFCNGDERCEPGGPRADARGCVQGSSPCVSGETCFEDASRCMPADCTTPDVDGDGHDSIACGGGDCNDDDPLINPGVAEDCDDVDDDCDPSTLAGADGDSDMDGFTSVVCCNPQPSGLPICGDDCDDVLADVHPGVSEACNGRNDDCDEVTDESSGSDLLCPGGLCLAGSCQLDAWEIPFGDTRHDYVMDVAVDGAGGVIVAGRFSGSIDFGSGPAGHAGVVAVGFTPDGRHSWDHDVDPCVGLGGSVPIYSAGIAVDGAGNVYLAACCTASGNSQTMVSSFQADGTPRWTHATFAGCGDSIEVARDNTSIIVGGYLSGTSDFGGGIWTSNQEDGFVLELLAGSGGYENERRIGASGDQRVLDVAAGAGGSVVVGLDVGSWMGSACFELDGDRSCEVSTHGSVAVISSMGSLVWDRSIGREVTAVAVAPGGDVMAGGVFAGLLSVGGPDVMAMGSSRQVDGVVVAYDSMGAYQWKRHLESPGVVSVNDIDVGPDSTVVVTGAFSETVLLFGSPAGEGRTDRDLYVAWYGRDGSRVRELTIGSVGNDDSLGVGMGNFRDVAFGGVFMGTVSLGSGTHTSRGLGDGFVVRTTY